jgi:hypothetical protein
MARAKRNTGEQITSEIPSVTTDALVVETPQEPTVAPEVAADEALSPAESSQTEAATDTVAPAQPPQEAVAAPEPNIILSRDTDPATGEPYEPIELINMGMSTIELPDAATQRAGWFDKKAGLIVRATAPRYKLYKNLGD